MKNSNDKPGFVDLFNPCLYIAVFVFHNFTSFDSNSLCFYRKRGCQQHNTAVKLLNASRGSTWLTGMYVTKYYIILYYIIMLYFFLFLSLADEMSTSYSKPSFLHSAI